MKKNNKILILAAVLAALVFIALSDKQIDVNSKTVTNLYKYLGEVNINHCGGLITYSDKTMTKEEISEVKRLCMAYNNLDKSALKEESLESDNTNEFGTKTCKVGDNTILAADNDSNTCTYTKIDEKKLKESYSKIYGSDFKEVNSFSISDTKTCIKEGEGYYCGSSETYTMSLGEDTTIYRLITKAVKKLNGNILIYDNFLKISNDKCYSKNNNEENKTCSAYLKNSNIDLNDEQAIKDLIEKYGSTYIHTFKLNKNKDQGLYWSKTEVK